MVRTWRLLVLIMLLVRGLVAVEVARTSARSSPDFDRFWAIASSPAIPYVAYRVEYTPFAVALFQALRPATADRIAFGRAMVAIACAADLATAGALIAAFGWKCGATYLLVTFPLLGLLYNRFDFVPTAAATIAVAGWRLARPKTAAAALAAAVAFKLWALPLTAFLLVDRRPRLRRRQTSALLVAAALVGIAWLALAGGRGTIQVVTFRGAGGWQIESLIGNVLALSSHATLRYELNAYRIGSVSSETIVACLTIGMEAAFALAWFGTRRCRAGATWLASIGTLLVFSPLLSPQFMAWLAPGAAIAWVEHDHWPAGFAIAAQWLTAAFFAHYDDLLRGSPWELAVFARNLCLCAMILVVVVPSLRAMRAQVDLRQEAT